MSLKKILTAVSTNRNFSPLRMLTTLAILIFIAEVVAMAILYVLPLPNYVTTALLDGTIMLVMILPALYLLQLKPLLTQIDERMQAEQALRTSEDKLKEEVGERKRAQNQLAHQNEELLALSRAERHQRKLAESLVQTTLILNESLELDKVLGSILEQIRKMIPFQGASVILRENQLLEVAGVLGYEDFPELAPNIGSVYELSKYPVWQQVCETLQPINADVADIHAGDREEWVQSFLAAPLLINHVVIGTINLVSEQADAFNQEDIDLLSAFTAPASLALHNARLFEAESAARQIAETLCTAAQALTKTLDPENIIETLLDHLGLMVDTKIAGVTLLEDETNLVVRAVRQNGTSAKLVPTPSLPIDSLNDPVIRQFVLAGESFLIPQQIPNYLRGKQAGPKGDWQWLIVPILAGEQVIGLVELGDLEDDTYFSREFIYLAEALVSQAAVAMQNAWLFQQVRSSSDRLKSLARKLVEIQENERLFIARELHDEAGQALSLLKLSLGRLEQDRDCPPHISQRLEDLKGLVDGVLEELHHLAVNLRPIALDHLGLVPAVDQYAKKLDNNALTVRFKAFGFENGRLPQEIETGLYRIMQEAMTNIVRHAQATTVGILLERGEDKVKLFVEDDGIGFESDLSTYNNRLGIVGMRERAEMFGGTLTIESQHGGGTSIIVEVPNVYSPAYSG